MPQFADDACDSQRILSKDPEVVADPVPSHAMGAQQSLNLAWSNGFRYSKAHVRADVTMEMLNLTIGYTLGERSMKLECGDVSLTTDVSVDVSGTFSVAKTITISELHNDSDFAPGFSSAISLDGATSSRKHKVHEGVCSNKKIEVFAWTEVSAALSVEKQGFWTKQWATKATVEVSLKVQVKTSDVGDGLPNLLLSSASHASHEEEANPLLVKGLQALNMAPKIVWEHEFPRVHEAGAKLQMGATSVIPSVVLLLV